MGLNQGTFRSVAAALRSGATTSVRLTRAALQAVDRLDDRLHSFAFTDPEGAFQAATAADQLLASGHDPGPLTGIPIGMKDIVHMAGLPTRCGSPAYSEQPQSHDATIVTRLREAGAVIVGKTTVHELACGVFSPPATNPWDVSRIPGGSSGGSGAAVAAGIVPMAVGSDTGGSIRIPASLCGVTGLKPTYGRVSKAGVEPLSWSLDHLGPLAATVEDCAFSLGAMAGPDPADPSCLDVPVPDYTAGLDRGVSGLRLGVLAGEPFAPMQPDVSTAFHRAVELLRSLGAEPVMVEIPELAYALPTEFALLGPEAALYHLGLLQQQPELIDPAIRSMLTAAALMPTGHYLKSRQARLIIKQAFRRCFAEHQLTALVTPTLPATAARADQPELEYENRVEDVTISYVRTTAPFNLTGMPALTVPCGFDRAGLPIGLQFAAAPFAEATVLQFGAAFQASTAWLEHQPPVHVSAS